MKRVRVEFNETNFTTDVKCYISKTLFKISCMIPEIPKCFWDFLVIFFFCYDLIDTSLWWSDMIDFCCLSPRRVIFIYLPRLPLLLSCSLFFFTPTGRILGNSHLLILNCQSFAHWDENITHYIYCPVM